MMIQTGSQMIPLWALLVTLFCGFPAARGAAIGAAAASKSDCYRKTCMDKEYNISEATCCENQLHPGEGLSCCGEQAFNPEEATCCKVGDGHNTTAVTEGLSQKVSVCCGLKAYNKLNEMCCQSTVVTKPGPKAECCGTGAYDDDTQLCCGPENNKKIWKKTSSDNKCCGRDQFDAKTQYCSNVTVTIHSISESRNV
ncbi:uncharacterized protein LOC141771640 isoform X2 [Sebastes fasciatus]|uniref:uncharacterized protein LOC141771640 isoform X2 n=1 Tax=Sebastes fasciatus TaxID=394691 RepID=UPI003D9ECB47